MGVVCLAFTGMMVGFSEPNLVRFLIDRLPIQNAFGARLAQSAKQSGLYKEKKDNKDKRRKKKTN